MKRKKINKRKKKAFCLLCSAVMVTAILCARCMCCRCAVCSDCLTVRPFCLADCFRDWLRCPGVTPCRVCLAWLRLLWLSWLGCLCLRFSLAGMRKGSARFIPCRAFCVCSSMNFRRVWFPLLATPCPPVGVICRLFRLWRCCRDRLGLRADCFAVH